MLSIAVNHMTVPNMRYDETLALAANLGCSGVEFRNDLDRALFDDEPCEDVLQAARSAKQTIYALAEVKAFNQFTEKTRDAATNLAGIAKRIGAKGISLIPANDGSDVSANDLKNALSALKPILDERELLGFVEPLGFPSSTLRRKADAVEAIEAIDGSATFKLIHDTFHHHLSGETDFFARETAIVHISGVSDPAVSVEEMTDAHRGLVDAQDRLGNIEQIRGLIALGYSGPISFEPFAPDFHAHPAPAAALATSIAYVRDSTAALAA